ncbi:MAG: DUF3515 domain-containing protein [Pseudonocardiaceae bacterium]
MDVSPAAGTPRWILGIALALPVVLILGVLVAAAVVRGQRPGPLLLVATVPAPEADSDECARLLAALPPRLEGAGDRRELAAPAPSGMAAWGAPPVVLHCGIGRPADLTATSRLLDVSGVRFLGPPGLSIPYTGTDTGSSSWVAVDRPVYLVVTLPPQAGSGPLQQAAEVIAQTLARR